MAINLRAPLIDAVNMARMKFWGVGGGKYFSSSYDKGPDLLNGHYLSALNTAGASVEDLIGLNATGYMVLAVYEAALRNPIQCQIQPQASIVTGTPFFVNGSSTIALDIARITCVFSTANGAALTGYITKEIASPTTLRTAAPGTGTAAMTNTFDLNATANTLQSATLAARGGAGVTLQPGEQLSLVLSTTTTSLVGLMITVWVKPHWGYVNATLFLQANAAIATKTFYLNLIPGRTVASATARWSAAGTDAGAVTLDITKDTSTNAPGAGTSILAATQSLKATANTTYQLGLSATAASLLLAGNDRLAFKLTGTPTTLAGLVINVTFDSGQTEVITVVGKSVLNAGVDFNFFTADRYYEVDDFWGTWSVVASTGGRALLTKDTGTTAPGAGSALLSDNSNAGLDTTATANTPVEGTLVTNKETRILAPGDRLGIKHAGTTGSLAGETYAVRLRKI